MDASKIEAELGWRPAVTFEAGIEMTVSWYLENGDWWRSILDRDNATERRGVAHG